MTDSECYFPGVYIWVRLQLRAVFVLYLHLDVQAILCAAVTWNLWSWRNLLLEILGLWIVRVAFLFLFLGKVGRNFLGCYPKELSCFTLGCRNPGQVNFGAAAIVWTHPLRRRCQSLNFHRTLFQLQRSRLHIFNGNRHFQEQRACVTVVNIRVPNTEKAWAEWVSMGKTDFLGVNFCRRGHRAEYQGGEFISLDQEVPLLRCNVKQWLRGRLSIRDKSLSKCGRCWVFRRNRKDRLKYIKEIWRQQVTLQYILWLFPHRYQLRDLQRLGWRIWLDHRALWGVWHCGLRNSASHLFRFVSWFRLLDSPQ